MSKKLTIKSVLDTLGQKYISTSSDFDLFAQPTDFLDKHITPAIFAFSAEGISLQTNNDVYDGEVLDFCGQTVTCLLGQNDPWVTANIIAFMLSGHASFLSTSIGQKIYYEIPQMFREISKMGTDSYVNHRLNNGSDATDLAIDIAYNFKQGKKRRLISFKGSYHGQGHLPYGASALQYHLRFFNNLDVFFAEAPTHVENIDNSDVLSESDKKILASIRAQSSEAFAIIIEPIQFNNNGNTVSRAFLKELRFLCDELGLPLIFDEVQTAWGWLGTMTAAERYGIWPDIMALSKSITSGYGPLAAVIAKRKFEITSSFGARTNGSDVRSLVAAKAVKERLMGVDDVPKELAGTQLGSELKEGLLRSFPQKSQFLLNLIHALKAEVNNNTHLAVKIGAIKGDGLARMIEIKTRDNKFNSEVTRKLQKHLLLKGGVFVRTPSNNDDVHTLFIKMPIVASELQMSTGFDRMRKAFETFRLE